MKIFRKLRQQLLFKTNIRKYLLYAIGEIVLVVIGILIAVSINNWKNGIERDKKEIALYKNLIEELQIDLGEIRGNMEYNQNYMTRYQRGSEIILTDTNFEKVDTLALIALAVTKFSDFKNESSAYEKLNISGKIDLITDNDILNDLQNLAILYTYINRIEQNQTDVMYMIAPKLTRFLRIKPLQVMDRDEMYGYQFHNDLELILSICNEKDVIYKEAENDLNRLIQTLQNKIQ